MKYKSSPPVGGDHNPSWQNCMGDVYNAPIPNEHAVHSLEHGAVWITYRPDLPRTRSRRSPTKVEGKEYMLMSPFAGLDKPISLQAWGYQLKVDNADDAPDRRLHPRAARERHHGARRGLLRRHHRDRHDAA